MNRFELGACETRLQERGHPDGIIVQELLQRAHAVDDLVGRRGHVDRIPRAGAANPVLRAAELPGLLLTPAPFAEENPVDFPKQPQREGKALVQPLQAVIQRCDIVGHLDDIVHRDAGHFLALIEEKIRERGLRPLNLRRENRFFPDVEIQRQLRIRQKLGDAIEPTERPIGPLDEIPVVRRQVEVAIRGKRIGIDFSPD